MLPKLEVKDVVHDPDVDLEPVGSLQTSKPSSFLERFAGTGNKSDPLRQLRSAIQELVCLED
jgi:hypothetical protein